MTPPPPDSRARLHRRLTLLAGGFGILAFCGGARQSGWIGTGAALLLLVAALFPPSIKAGRRLERLGLPIALLLLARTIWVAFTGDGATLTPISELILFLLASEALRNQGVANEGRIGLLSFALVLAAIPLRPGPLYGVALVGWMTTIALALGVGQLRHREAHRVRAPAPGGGNRMVAGLFLLSLATAGSGLLLFLALPRIGGPPQGSDWEREVEIAGFGEGVSLGSFGRTIEPNPRTLLRVEFPGEVPDGVETLLFRGRSFDRFDGERWSRSPVPADSSVAALAAPDRWGEARIEQRIYAEPLAGNPIFGIHPVIQVTPEGGITPWMDPFGDLSYMGSGAVTYQVVSLSSRPTFDIFRDAERSPRRRGGPGDLYLQLPETLSPGVAALADSLTDDLSTRLEKIEALVTWFRREFAYSLDLPDTPEETSIEHFLFARRAGHCEYFSTALILLLRTQGIHARQVTGFLGGDWNAYGNFLSVSGNRAHSWAEVWFPQIGWVPFDATPPGAAEQERLARHRWREAALLLDGVRHGWGKWVLDYPGPRQIEEVIRAAQTTDRDSERPTASGRRSAERSLPLAPGILLLLLLAALGWGILAIRRRRVAGTDLFRALRRSYATAFPEARRGSVPIGSLPPLALLELLERMDAPGLPHAARIVRADLEARYGGRPLVRGEGRRLRRDLHAIRKSLSRRKSSREKDRLPIDGPLP